MSVYNSSNPYALRIYNGEDEMKVIEEIINLYLNSKNWMEVGKKTGVNHQTIRTFVTRRELKLRKHNPELFKRYLTKTGKNRDEEYYNGMLEIGEAKQFTIDVLKALPKRISYFDFINLMCTYRTGTMTSEELVNLANSVGVDVVG